MPLKCEYSVKLQISSGQILTNEDVCVKPKYVTSITGSHQKKKTYTILFSLVGFNNTFNTEVHHKGVYRQRSCQGITRLNLLSSLDC